MLHLTLYEKYFYEILEGEKIEEYRKLSRYWIKRIFHGRKLKHDTILFRNGYGEQRPWMVVELKDYTFDMKNKLIVLKLGKIVSWGTCTRPSQNKA